MAGNRVNLYVRDGDLEVWNKVKQMSSKPLSETVAILLRRYVAECEAGGAVVVQKWEVA